MAVPVWLPIFQSVRPSLSNKLPDTVLSTEPELEEIDITPLESKLVVKPLLLNKSRNSPIVKSEVIFRVRERFWPSGTLIILLLIPSSDSFVFLVIGPSAYVTSDELS